VASHLWRPLPPPTFVGLSAVQLPDRPAGFVTEGDFALPENVQAQLSSGDIVTRHYAQENNPASFIEFYLIGGTDRTALHDPRGCLTGAGWKIQNDHTETLPGATDKSGAGVLARFCEASGGGASGETYEILYLYVVDGQVVQQVTQIRWQMMLSALVGARHRPVYFCVMQRLRRADPIQDAEEGKQLRRFAGEMWQAMQLEKLQTTPQTTTTVAASKKDTQE
jgi:hypothetical protein